MYWRQTPCMDLRELSLPGGFLLLLPSAASQLPGFIYLARYLDGDVTVCTPGMCMGSGAGTSSLIAS